MDLQEYFDKYAKPLPGGRPGDFYFPQEGEDALKAALNGGTGGATKKDTQINSVAPRSVKGVNLFSGWTGGGDGKPANPVYRQMAIIKPEDTVYPNISKKAGLMAVNNGGYWAGFENQGVIFDRETQKFYGNVAQPTKAGERFTFRNTNVDFDAGTLNGKPYQWEIKNLDAPTEDLTTQNREIPAEREISPKEAEIAADGIPVKIFLEIFEILRKAVEKYLRR